MFQKVAARGGLILILLAVVAGEWGCAIRRTVHITPAQPPGLAKEASLAELVKDIDAWSGRIDTLTASVDFEPTTVSVYSGVINQYHDVHGFILLKKPSMIRVIGQAPIVGTSIFDMVSDGDDFRLSIPPQNKFIVGKTSYHGRPSNSLENLRPQHILEALLIPPIDHAKESFFSEEAQSATRSYYIVTIVQPGTSGELSLNRKIWFDRSDLNISRLELYGLGGVLLEDVQYANYQDFKGIQYPSAITVDRPSEGYTLTIGIENATFNQPLPPAKFTLQKPAGATLVDLNGAAE